MYNSHTLAIIYTYSAMNIHRMSGSNDLKVSFISHRNINQSINQSFNSYQTKLQT